jgi:hypothetical protein
LEIPHTTESQVLLKNQYLMMKKLDALPTFNETGFSVYSQHEEDGLLLYIFSIIGVTNKILVEICAGNGKECNAANLIINHKWKGLLFDGDKNNVKEGIDFFKGIQSCTFWPPKFVHAWITRFNINQLIKTNNIIGEIDLLSLDIDGNDWYLLKDIDVINPRVIILEFNHLIGPDKTLSVPYSDSFKAVFTEYGSDYAGASLNAFVQLCNQKNYRLIGTNEIGTNAFFIRNDIGQKEFVEVQPNDCLKHPRSIFGQTVRYEKIKDMDWVDIKELL